MLSPQSFVKEFEKRHDFQTSEVTVLESHFPNTKFRNIPEAWIWCIDQMLERIYKIDSKAITSVYQLFGLLCVEPSRRSPKIDEIISEYEKKMYFIDMDLRKEISDTQLN